MGLQINEQGNETHNLVNVVLLHFATWLECFVSGYYSTPAIDVSLDGTGNSPVDFENMKGMVNDCSLFVAIHILP